MGFLFCLNFFFSPLPRQPLLSSFVFSSPKISQPTFTHGELAYHESLKALLFRAFNGFPYVFPFLPVARPVPRFSLCPLDLLTYPLAAWACPTKVPHLNLPLLGSRLPPPSTSFGRHFLFYPPVVPRIPPLFIHGTRRPPSPQYTFLHVLAHWAFY